nr:hypothetical protein [uncultured Holophaga sp.]
MDRFGSSRLRIVFVCISLLLAGLVLGGIHPAEGGNLSVFGTPVQVSALTIMVDPQAVFRGGLISIISTLVPATFLLPVFFPVHESLKGGGLKALPLNLGVGILNGLFYTQILLLPVWAASLRLMGSPFPWPLCLADLHSLILGLQLLLWALFLARILTSNPGWGLLLAFGLSSLGHYFTWGGDYLGDPDLFQVPTVLVKGMALLGRLLPTGQVPSDPLAWGALPLNLGGPLVLLILLLLIPARQAKKAKAAPRRSKG